MNFAEDILNELREKSLYRALKNSVVKGAKINLEGRDYLNFASNDYLGISANINWQKEFLEGLSFKNTFLMSSVASRLLAGNNVAYDSLESLIASTYNEHTPDGIELDCLVFNSGYHANTGVLPALSGARDLIIADKQVHASLIDSLSLTKAKWLRFKHNDYANLEEILEKNRAHFENVFIVTESVFSMDADVADLKRLVEIKEKYNCYLYVDEAHSIGVFGEDGLGFCAELALLDKVDFMMATMGKALASEGAFLLCKKEFRDLLINKCRSFIFTTAIAPLNVLWSEFVFKKLFSMKEERQKLVKFSEKIKAEIENASGERHIISIILGDNERAIEMQKKLMFKNIYAPAIRHPSVPKNTARLRLSLSGAMQMSDIEEFIKSYKECLK